jgi:hypothetical protein
VQPGARQRAGNADEGSDSHKPHTLADDQIESLCVR